MHDILVAIIIAIILWLAGAGYSGIIIAILIALYLRILGLYGLYMRIEKALVNLAEYIDKIIKELVDTEKEEKEEGKFEMVM